jgi:6-methylsalicylate decarboxylase
LQHTTTCAETVRRSAFLAGLSGAGAAVALGGHRAAAQGVARTVDVHHHYASPLWLELARKTGKLDERSWNGWTPERSLEQMDTNGVSVSMLSVTYPGVNFGDDAAARKLARECNDYAAKLQAAHPTRFGTFVGLPLPDIQGSLAEIAYGMDVLKMDGVGLFTSYGDKWLGDPAYAPIYEELNRRKALVFCHPTTANCCTNLVPTINDSEIEYGTDTTRAIARMIFSGWSAKYPNIRVIFSHAGGTMPFLNERFIHWSVVPQFKPLMPNGFVAEAAKFYYDVAQATNPAAMSALSKIIPTSQILFGSDYPYLTITENNKGLRDCGVFSAGDLDAIYNTNVTTLVPRLAPRRKA